MEFPPFLLFVLSQHNTSFPSSIEMGICSCTWPLSTSWTLVRTSLACCVGAKKKKDKLQAAFVKGAYGSCLSLPAGYAQAYVLFRENGQKKLVSHGEVFCIMFTGQNTRFSSSKGAGVFFTLLFGNPCMVGRLISSLEPSVIEKSRVVAVAVFHDILRRLFLSFPFIASWTHSLDRCGHGVEMTFEEGNVVSSPDGADEGLWCLQGHIEER